MKKITPEKKPSESEEKRDVEKQKYTFLWQIGWIFSFLISQRWWCKQKNILIFVVSPRHRNRVAIDTAACITLTLEKTEQQTVVEWCVRLSVICSSRILRTNEQGRQTPSVSTSRGKRSHFISHVWSTRQMQHLYLANYWGKGSAFSPAREQAH